MKAILTLYVKLFVVFGLFFGMFTGLIDLFGDDTFDVNRLFNRASFYGFWMSLILGTIHIIALKRLGLKSFTTSDLSVNQHRRVSSNINFTQLVDKLKSIPLTEKMELSDSGHGLTFQTRASWKSWGEKIKIEVLRETETGTEYEIYSQPKRRTVLIDNGRNLQNVMKIEQLLS